MKHTVADAGSYFLHTITVYYVFQTVSVEITQHVRVAGTAGFYIAAKVDVQTTPGCSTVSFFHVII
jgi:hypothetical protein